MDSEAMTTVPGRSGPPGRLELQRTPRPLGGAVGAGSPAVGEVLAEVGRSEADLRRFLHGLPGVDQVGAPWRTGS